MQRTDFAAMTCPIARGLDRVGAWWSILILRDAFAGLTKFDEFQKSLGIAPGMLTRRLDDLVAAGLLERRVYCARPRRASYHLTAPGRDFRPVLIAWGNRHFAPEGPSVAIVEAATGIPAEPMLIDRRTGRPLAAPDYALAPGPGATPASRARLARGTTLLDAVAA